MTPEPSLEINYVEYEFLNSQCLQDGVMEMSVALPVDLKNNSMREFSAVTDIIITRSDYIKNRKWLPVLFHYVAHQFVFEPLNSIQDQ